MTTTTDSMTGSEIVELCRRHTLFEWSAQAAVDPIPVAHAKGIYFWTPEGKRFIDFNSQLMCVNIGHGDERVVNAIKKQAETLPYANPFMATDVRARLGAKLAELTPGDIDAFFFTNGGAEATENAIRIARLLPEIQDGGQRSRGFLVFFVFPIFIMEFKRVLKQLRKCSLVLKRFSSSKEPRQSQH